jgi:hypothetical protein
VSTAVNLRVPYTINWNDGRFLQRKDEKGERLCLSQTLHANWPGFILLLFT